MNPDTLQLYIGVGSYAHDITVVSTLAFSGDPIDRWRGANVDKPYTIESDIPHMQLERDARHTSNQGLQPGVVCVTALLDGQVAGVAVWDVPRRHRRTETLSQLAYRKYVEYQESLADWWSPPPSLYVKRQEIIRTLRLGYAERHLGKGQLQKTWYLKTLAVLPSLQRKGVGTALVQWGLERAKETGEKIYVDSSYVGKPLYLKLGFREVGGFVVADSGVRVSCMLWEPSGNL